MQIHYPKQQLPREPKQLFFQHYALLIQQLQQELFTGKVETLERSDVIHMTVSQVLDSNINIEGDEFFAEVTNEVCGDKGVIIPKGTIAHGKITHSGDPKRMGRSAWLELSFDYKHQVLQV